MKIKPGMIYFVVSAIILLGCTLTQVQIPTKTQSQAQEPVIIPSTEIQTLSTATPELTEVVEEPTDRWMLYEDALAARLLSIPMTRGAGYCEWEILGQEGEEVYLWAICQVAGDPEGSATSAPVVVTLSSDGMIAGVEMPRDGSLWGEDARAMFPEDLWSAIFFETTDIDGMWAHIQSRHANPEPPLITLSGIPLP